MATGEHRGEPSRPRRKDLARLAASAHDTGVAVIGLGRFGSSLANTLVEMGHEVMGVDLSEALVQEHAKTLTHVVQADTTRQDALKQLGIVDFDAAVVAIGTGIESSVLTVAALADLGIAQIWAKAITADHGRILERVGANHVVYPEYEMGARVAHLVTGRMIDYVQLDEGFALVETATPTELVGKTLGESGVRAHYGVTVLCVKPTDGPVNFAGVDTRITEGDLLWVAGAFRDVEAFAVLT